MKALVLGAGVSGLSCAERLCEHGFEVVVWARERQQATTSSVAGAIWYPFHAQPLERVRGWAFESLARFEELARDPASGVVWRTGREVFAPGVAPPAWMAELPGLRELAAGELPPGFARGSEFRAPVIEMPVYLAWLERRVIERGASVETRAVESFEQAFAHAPLVVNATGLGARELAGDRDLHAVRGQLIRVARRGLERFWFDDRSGPHPTYVIPRAHDVVLGGSVEDGAEECTTGAEILQSIRARCLRLEPALAGATELGTGVGLRPARSVVRLEAEPRGPDRLLIHDYGHGGAGVTLSWGCAEEVAGIARRWRDRA